MTANDVLALLDRLVLGAVEQDVRADLGQLADMLLDAGFERSASFVRVRGEFNGVQTLVPHECLCNSKRDVRLICDARGNLRPACSDCRDCDDPIRECPNCGCVWFED